MSGSRRDTSIFLIRNTPAFLAVGIAAIALGIRFFVTNDINLYISLLVSMVALLTTNTVIGLYEARKDREVIQTVKQKVADIERFTMRERTTFLADSPESLDQYQDLWGGFEGDYLVYNGAFHVEQRPGISHDELVDWVYLPRYKNEKFKAYYLFLTDGESGTKDLKLFRDLMYMVKAKYPKVVSKIEVRQISNKDCKSQSEMYLGVKGGVETSIIEPIEQGMTQGRGSPYHYVVTTNDQVTRRLRAFFFSQWEQAAKVDLFQGEVIEKKV